MLVRTKNPVFSFLNSPDQSLVDLNTGEPDAQLVVIIAHRDDDDLVVDTRLTPTQVLSKWITPRTKKLVVLTCLTPDLLNLFNEVELWSLLYTFNYFCS